MHSHSIQVPFPSCDFRYHLYLDASQTHTSSISTEFQPHTFNYSTSLLRCLIGHSNMQLFSLFPPTQNGNSLPRVTLDSSFDSPLIPHPSLSAIPSKGIWNHTAYYHHPHIHTPPFALTPRLPPPCRTERPACQILAHGFFSLLCSKTCFFFQGPSQINSFSTVS